eukprot:TRINITY_DN125_c0_g1_i1.p2 TRINITY_DN125_c0_g1~~TRINITY_DN125_c0_g1_i1.p2  ORF type:complete len:176 (+),score=68.66 TRINITY_DN125_c0_g1_i1:75-530(+)
MKSGGYQVVDVEAPQYVSPQIISPHCQERTNVVMANPTIIAPPRPFPVPAAQVGLVPKYDENVLYFDRCHFLFNAYNQLYKLGFNAMFVFLTFLTIVVSPFLGLFVGLVEFSSQLARSMLRPFGRAVADATGYGTWLQLKAKKLEQELHIV